MRVTEIDLVVFIEDVKSYFETMAQSKQIQYTFQHDVSSVRLWVDTDKMEKILANLLSNAFKFTPDGGTITIRLQDHAGYVTLSVEDNGKGIQPQNLSAVFDQFFTGDNLTGTGIGLHLTHEFVSMHKGSIHVESEPGKRTIFFVELPKGKSHFDETCTFTPSVTELSSGVANLDTREMDEIVNRTYDYTILVVEDDPDINAYLQKELKSNFRILTAVNGVVAIDILAKENISLVISDVMMLEMDGLELCRNIKSNLETSHIPVILLTAKNTAEDRIECYNAGADGYISKPFELKILEARINNFIIHKKSKQEEFRTNVEVDIDSLETSSIDKDFLDKVVSVIKSNMAEGDFDVVQLADALAVSKSSLYRKMKIATGLSPIEFIRNIRLKHGSQLLKNKSMSIAEVAYECGFSNPKYFATCFKEDFGVTPKEYQKSC